MKTKRLKAIFTGYIAMSVILAGVCGVLCFTKGDVYTRSAVSQRADSVVIKRYRGKIYDRNGVSLVDNDCKELRLDGEGIINFRDGELIASVPVRYSSDSIARHIIGYVDSEGVGVSGVEKIFEDILKVSSEDRVSVIKSANGRIIRDTYVSHEESHPSGSVTLTLDSRIQTIAEKSLKSRGITGAVVVLDTETFDVLAMASTPDYDQNDIRRYINSPRGEFVNRCIMPYNAGSIFKIVTMCSAGERKLIRPQYTCLGAMTIGENTFGCNNPQGHGTMNSEEAFSHSCNCAFYTMGMDVGGSAISDTAKKLGVGKPLLCHGGIEGESSGNIPEPEDSTDTVNYSIGQGEILITPLQAANIACIIARGGVARDVNIIREIRYPTGNQIRPQEDGEYRAVSQKTAEYVGKCMASAVKCGTASSLADNIAQIAGKTGTAETGWMVEGKTLVHGWFCGYFPRENPRYAMAVLAEGEGSGAASAAPVFGEIAEAILKC